MYDYIDSSVSSRIISAKQVIKPEGNVSYRPKGKTGNHVGIVQSWQIFGKKIVNVKEINKTGGIFNKRVIHNQYTIIKYEWK
jgi:hypothetical protein